MLFFHSDAQEKIGYEFKNSQLLRQCFTHSSYAHEHGGVKNNERLEFFGDSVLKLFTSKLLYEKYANYPEGDLSKIRSMIVSEKPLAEAVDRLGLDKYLIKGVGESRNVTASKAIKCDMFEAIVGAVYLDGGFDVAKAHVLRFIKDELFNHNETDGFKDYKTALQEIIQRNPEESVTYILTNETGPDHDKVFEVEVRLNSNTIGRGKGKNKKSSEMMAAKNALENLD